MTKEKKKRKILKGWVECLASEDANPLLIRMCKELNDALRKINAGLYHHYAMVYGVEPEEDVLIVSADEFGEEAYTVEVDNNRFRLTVGGDTIIYLDLDSGTYVGKTVYGPLPIDKYILDKVFRATGAKCRAEEDKITCMDVTPENVDKVIRASAVLFAPSPDEVDMADEFGNLRNYIQHIKKWLDLPLYYKPEEYKEEIFRRFGFEFEEREEEEE